MARRVRTIGPSDTTVNSQTFLCCKMKLPGVLQRRSSRACLRRRAYVLSLGHLMILMRGRLSRVRLHASGAVLVMTQKQQLEFKNRQPRDIRIMRLHTAYCPSL